MKESLLFRAVVGTASSHSLYYEWLMGMNCVLWGIVMFCVTQIAYQEFWLT